MRRVRWVLLLLSLSALSSTGALPQDAATPNLARPGTVGEFALITSKPLACESVRNVPRVKPPFSPTRNNTQSAFCGALSKCADSVLSQSRALVQFLQANPSVVAAIQSYYESLKYPPTTLGSLIHDLKASLEHSDERRKWFEKRSTAMINLIWQRISWKNCSLDFVLQLPTDPSNTEKPSLGIVKRWDAAAFERTSIAGRFVLNKIRTGYHSDTAEYPDLIAFVDKYPGVEALDRAYTAYRKAFEDDDIVKLIGERPAMLKALEQAKARKHLLMQQSAQISHDAQTLSDFATVLDRETLAKVIDQRAPTSLSELRHELSQLGQMAPAQRGDVSLRLGVIAMRINDIDMVVRKARSEKEKVEQTRISLYQDESAVRNILENAGRAESKPAFDEQFLNSCNELIKRIRELASLNLEILRDEHEKVEAAKKKLQALQKEISGAQGKYDAAEKLDKLRRKVIERASATVTEFAQPENRGRLSNDGLSTIATLKTETDTLSSFDTIPMINRPNYSKRLSATEDALDKTEQFKVEMAQITLLTTGLKKLNGRIGDRGWRLLDNPTSSQLAELNKSLKTVSAAKVPLVPESRHHSQRCRAFWLS